MTAYGDAAHKQTSLQMSGGVRLAIEGQALRVEISDGRGKPGQRAIVSKIRGYSSLSRFLIFSKRSDPMKNILVICAIVILLQGCGEDISTQIEGVRWVSAKRDSNWHLRFINGELHTCLEEPDKPGYKILFNTWKMVANYKIDDGKLVTVYKDNERRISNIRIEGEGDSRVLVVTDQSEEKTSEHRYVIATRSNCPI